MEHKDDGGRGDDGQHRRARSHHDKNRQQRNDGRYAERRGVGRDDGTDNNNNDNRMMRRSMSSIPSLRSSSTTTSSSNHSPGSGSSKNSRGGGRRSPGSPPLPPPPRTTTSVQQRGRTSSFHSTSTHGTLPTSNITNSSQQRGRSSSTHSNHPSRSSSTRHSNNADKQHRERDDEHEEMLDNRRGRSLPRSNKSKSSSRSTSHNAAPISCDRYNNSDLPLIDANGRHRPRSQSNRRTNNKSSSSMKKKSQDSRSKGGRDDPQVVAVDNNVYTTNHHHHQPPPPPSTQKTFKQFITENEEPDPRQKSFKQVMAENTLLRHHSSSTGSSSKSSESRRRERSRSQSTSRSTSSRKKGSSSSPQKKRIKNKKRVDNVHQADQVSSKNNRKFVIEISTTTNDVVQIFEFTSNGQPPKDDKLIENIRNKYSNVMASSTTASNCSSISNGSPCIEKTRKFVVETDGKDNIVRVVEISKNGTSVDISNSNSATTAPAQSSSRDTSPFTKREQEYDKKYKTKEVEGEDTSSLPRRSASDGGSSSSSSNTKQRGGRSRSLSRAHSGRDSSLRSSFKSVSFVEEDKSKPSTVVDNNFDAVYKSLDTYHDVSEGHRRVTFLKDQEDIQARGSSLSKSFTKDQASSVAAAALCQPCDGDKSLATLDNKSQDESANASSRKSVMFDCIEEGENGTLTSQGPSPDTCGRSDMSMSSTLRRSVSFSMDKQDGNSSQASSRRSVSFLVNPEEEPQRGRAVTTKPITTSDLPGFRRARSLSSQRRFSSFSSSAEPDPNVIINDTSSMTSSVQIDPPTPLNRGRSVTLSSSRSSVSSMSISSKNLAMYAPPPPPRQARSLSRSRQPICDQIDFDPVSNEQPQENNYKVVHLKDMKDKVPTALTDSLVKKGISYSAGDTFVSELSADSYFTNHTNQTTNAVKEGIHRGGGQPLTNSPLVIFESECEEEEEELLLCDPLSNFYKPVPVNVHIMEDDIDESMYNAPKERRSRIRRMLSRKALAKRRQKDGLHSSLESEDTRETVESSKSWSDDVPSNQIHAHHRPKFRMSRFLHPRAA